MEWTSDIDPQMDNYQNTPLERDRAARLIGRHAENTVEHAELLRMMFAPTRRKVVQS